MKKLVLITNLPLDYRVDDNKNLEIINFNPWGFSKLELQKQITEVLATKFIPLDVTILYCVKDLFFGRRSEIAFKRLKELFPKNEVIRIDIECVNLLLNNSSI